MTMIMFDWGPPQTKLSFNLIIIHPGITILRQLMVFISILEFLKYEWISFFSFFQRNNQ